jgi:rhodanese-related sulfurtransferase
MKYGIFLAAGIALLIGCLGSDAATSISPNELTQLQAAGPVTLIDVRTPHEHAHEYIPGDTLIPLDVFDPTTLQGLPEPIIIYCHSGRRSTLAVRQVKARFAKKDVRSLAGGIESWKAAGFTIASPMSAR